MWQKSGVSESCLKIDKIGTGRVDISWPGLDMAMTVLQAGCRLFQGIVEIFVRKIPGRKPVSIFKVFTNMRVDDVS